MNKELLIQIRKHLEKVSEGKTFDIAEVEKQHRIILKAWKAIDDTSAIICGTQRREIHTTADCFLPLLEGKTDEDITIVFPSGENLYVKVKGISYTWFCLVAKNWFMA